MKTVIYFFTLIIFSSAFAENANEKSKTRKPANSGSSIRNIMAPCYSKGTENDNKAMSLVEEAMGEGYRLAAVVDVTTDVPKTMFQDHTCVYQMVIEKRNR